MCRRIKKRFNIEISETGTVISKTFELDKNITCIHSLLFTTNRDDLLYYRGTQKVEMNNREIFPEDYESKLLMSGINVPPNNRYYDLGELPPGNFKVKVEYKDVENTMVGFEPYRVSLYLDCTIDDDL
jgi:hypothetical protein